jgi:hypothetical protein
VIASSAHLSNGEIAIAASMNSKQTSRGLKLLEQRALIENASRAPGESNAWLLTPYGRSVLEVIKHSFAAAHLREEDDGLSGRASRRSVPRSEPGHGCVGRRAA